MIKSILIPSSGRGTDELAFAAALNLATPLQAHMDFFHVQLTGAEAMSRAPHAEFCIGAAIRSTLNCLDAEQIMLATESANQVHAFCEKNAINIAEVPGSSPAVTASYHQAVNQARQHVLDRARRSDLIVVSRPAHVDYMPADLIEELIVNSGRPVLIASESASSSLLGTVMIGWTETAQAARALTAALPLMAVAQRVIVVSVSEQPIGRRARELTDYLAWHGIDAEFHLVPGIARNAAERLSEVVVQQKVDLLVIGGYRRSPTREAWFGGVTQTFIDGCNIPVMTMH